MASFGYSAISDRTCGFPAVAAVIASLALASSAAAHGGAHSAGAPVERAGTKLRGCWMTVAYVPRPAQVLREAFPEPPDLTQTFYGPDPLLGVWALACDGARVGGKAVGRVTLSLVGAPVGLTVLGAPPLANFLSHALLRVDTDSRPLVAALRRRHLPARFAGGTRYLHSRRGALPFSGSLSVPGRYGLRVSAREPDPTNPHDHVNRFVFDGRGARTATLTLSTDDAQDRFCFPPSGDCAARLLAPPGSAMAEVIGGASVRGRAGFDHVRVRRLRLLLSAAATG